jgi:glycosyltransferase involved in cell wall biosynthesis
MKKNDLKILVIPSWYPPDGGFFFKEHGESIAAAGVQVDVLYNRVIGVRKLRRLRRGDLVSFRMRDENSLRVIRSWFFKLPGNEKLNAKRWISSTFRLFTRYRNRTGDPDLILAHSGIWAGCVAAMISGKYRIPYMIVEHRGIFLGRTEESRREFRSFYPSLLLEAFAGASRMVTVSGPMKAGLLKFDPGLESKIVILPNMINGDFFNLPEKERSRDPFEFIWAGRLVRMKRLDVLVSAFAELARDTDSDIRLRILGRGEERDNLQDLARKLGIQEQVEFTGRISREEVRNSYRQANCFVLTSEYESFGAVLIEAMATGLPVIATRCGGPETIVDNTNGYLFEPGNVNELKEAMARMIRDYSSFNQLQIRKKCLSRYGHHTIVKEYLKIFNEVVGVNTPDN